jgi:hypothetical protein
MPALKPRPQPHAAFLAPARVRGQFERIASEANQRSRNQRQRRLRGSFRKAHSCSVQFPLDRAHLRFDSVEILRLGNPVTNVLIAFRAMDTLLEDFELVRPNVLQAM